MNPDELARILRATPDEPRIPADPADLVHRRVRRRRTRRRGAAGVLAVALVAAVTGVAVTLPGGGGHRGTSRLHEATTPSVVPSSSASPTTRTSVPSHARSGVPAPTSTAPTPASAPAVRPPLAFAWHTHAVGDTVLVGGEWTGYGQVAPRTPGADVSTFIQQGSGVLAAQLVVLTSQGGELPAGSAPEADDYREAVVDSNGGIPRCSGPVSYQQRVLPPQLLTFARPGTYQVRMYSITCTGRQQQVSTLVTVGSAAGFRQTLTASRTTVTVGNTISLTARVVSPYGTPAQSVEVIGEDGSHTVLQTLRGGCTVSGQVSGEYTNDLGFTFHAPGHYVVLLSAGCGREDDPLDVTYQDAVTTGAEGPSFAAAVTVDVLADK